MRGGVSSRAGRRDLRAGVIAILLVTVAAGSLAIVHFARLSTSPLSGLGSADAGAPLERALAHPGPSGIRPAHPARDLPLPTLIAIIAPRGPRDLGRVRTRHGRRRGGAGLLSHPPARREAAVGRAVRPVGAGQADA